MCQYSTSGTTSCVIVNQFSSKCNPVFRAPFCDMNQFLLCFRPSCILFTIFFVIFIKYIFHLLIPLCEFPSSRIKEDTKSPIRQKRSQSDLLQQKPDCNRSILHSISPYKKNTSVSIINTGIRQLKDHKIYPKKDGILISFSSAIAFTIKFGALPI